MNNFAVAAVLSPLLLAALYPRVKRAGLRYDDIMTPPRRRRRRRWLGLLLIVVATLGGLSAGNLISTGRLVLPALTTDPPGTRAAAVGVGLSPAMLLLLIGVALL